MPRFVPRQRKHKVRERLEKEQGATRGAEQDNLSLEAATVETPGVAGSQNPLKQYILAQQNVKSSKKRKRLEKYIDNKLRKEENAGLIKRLASSKVDTSQLRPSSSLGARKGVRDGGLDDPRDRSKSWPEIDDESENPSSEQSNAGVSPPRPFQTLKPDEELEDAPSLPQRVTFGSGLKRQLDNNGTTFPAIKKRQRSNRIRIPRADDEEEASWDGFSSSAESEAENDFGSACSENGIIGHPASTSSDEEFSSEKSTSDDVDDKFAASGRKERASAFKAWATQQVNKAVKFTPLIASSDQSSSIHADTRPKTPQGPDHEDLLPIELGMVSQDMSRKSFSVQVHRSERIQEARMKLPVCAEEQKIMEAIHNNAVTVIWGATGSGKTTQVPQFLFEAGFGDPKSSNPGMIGITQPRRVAAVSVSKRVGEELGDLDGKVSYQVRFDASMSSRTALKFMTDGILLREIAADFLLSKYSVIIIDEAHERSTNTDILIGMISRIVDLREDMGRNDQKIRPLKLIIMSATLRIADFLDNPALFRHGRPPLVQTEGQQHAVTVHFSRRTRRDYVEEAFSKICKGHRRLPPGGMLVFLTGQNEIESLSKRLSVELDGNRNHGTVTPKTRITANDAPLETEDVASLGKQTNIWDRSEELGNQLEEENSDDEDEDEFEIGDNDTSLSKVLILPLYSLLPTKEQLRVFESPPEGCRLIVLATNIAETSLTIPEVRYVFDCGREKVKTFDHSTGIQSFDITWISKASATQRAGRAGRTGPGHCYRLYSSAIYEGDFSEHTQPEILKTPIENVVLLLKSLQIQNVLNFPFPTPPNRQDLAKAESLLTSLGAVTSEGKLTELGGTISKYPLSPRFAKMLAIGHQHDCMMFTTALVAALATPNIFIREHALNALNGRRKTDDATLTENAPAGDAETHSHKAYRLAHRILSRNSGSSDAIKALTALCAYAHCSDKEAFCHEMFLSQKAVSEAASLYAQLSSSVHDIHPLSSSLPRNAPLHRLTSPSTVQVKALQQFIAAAFIDQVALLASKAPNAPADLGPRPTRAIDVPYLSLFPIHGDKGTTSDVTDIAVYVHPSSLLAQHMVNELPTYIIYHTLQRAAPALVEDGAPSKKPKARMHPLTTVTGRQLAHLAKGTSLLEYGKPIGKIEESEMGKKRVCWVVPSLVNKSGGGVGWPLPAVKVSQVERHGSWEVENMVS